MSAQTAIATYTFHEMIDRIYKCSDENELRMYAKLLLEEKREYSILALRVLSEAMKIKQEFFIKGIE